MQRAIAALAVPPDHLLIDGNRLPASLPCGAEAVVKGDGRSMSIAAASIIAKTARDAIMTDLAQKYPGYGWERKRRISDKLSLKCHSRAWANPRA